MNENPGNQAIFVISSERSKDHVSPLFCVGGEVEVEAGLVLEFEAAPHAIALASNDDQWGHEADDGEILGKLVGIPHLTVASL
jgi:hypothetical protein